MTRKPPSPYTDALGTRVAAVLRLKLVVISGPNAGREFPLVAGTTYSVGSASENDIVLEDGAVSRNHLTVEVLPESLKVVDRQSTNGSFCNAVRFYTIEARPGMVLQLGRSELRVAAIGVGKGWLPPSARDRFGNLVGQSVKMRELFALLERVSESDSDVLILGETGTGKELCAEAIHQASARRRGPFVICDIAAVPPTLFESELFGHVKGAFTGAHADRAGAFERADGGTLFLDEVGDLPSELQPRLLRALERRQVKRVGGNEYRTVNVRVLAATHRGLKAEVQAGRFREDLYHRLEVVKVALPALRERLEDLPLLVDEMLHRAGKEPSQLSAETRALLASHSWPGNVRELRNVVERALSLGGEVALQTDGGRSYPRPPPEEAKTNQDIRADASLPFKDAKESLVGAFEKDYLSQLLRRCEGNVSRASREAGIDRVYLRRLLKKHGLAARDARDE